ncbi:hypothetical protein V8B97DRAFT_2024704 [Scleroderma yunnanense]
MSTIIQHLSLYLPDELEHNIFLLVVMNSPSNIPCYLLVVGANLIPGFAQMAVKVLHLWPAELTLQITTNLLDEENPLHGPLHDLWPTTLCMNITSVFYGPNIYLPNLHLHLMNSWLSQLTHLSFHIHPPGQRMTHPEVLFKIFKHFLRL